MAIEVGHAYVTILPSFRDFGKQVAKQVSGTGARAGQDFQKSFGSRVVSGLKRVGGLVAAAGIGVGLFQIGKAAKDSAIGIQQTTATLTGLYGSAETANDTLARLRKTAAGSPLEFAAFQQGAKDLAYMGYEGAQVDGVLKNVAAAIVTAGGSSEDMGRVTGAMLQMQNSGKVYADQLNQISEAGVPIFSGLASHFDTNIAHVRKMVEEGKVSLDDVLTVVQKAEGDTFKSMLKASDETSKTFSSQWAIARDNVVTQLGSMLVPVLDRLAPMVGKIGALLPGAVESGIAKAQDIFGSIGTAISDFAAGPGGRIFDDIVAGARDLIDGLFTLGRALAPVVEDFAKIVATGIIAGVALLGKVLKNVVGPAFKAIAGFVADNLNVFVPLAAAVAGFLVTLKVVTAVQTAYKAAQQAYAAWTYTQAAATGVFSTALNVMKAAFLTNPIGIIIAALVALGIGLVVAYKKSETFRKIVHGALDKVGRLGKWLWERALKPAFNGIKAALSAVADAAVWLWDKAIKPAFNGISAAVSAVGTAAKWLWNNAIKPAFNFITIAGKLLAVIIGTIIVVAFKALAAIAKWLWNSVLKPVFGFIGKLARWLWDKIFKPYIGFIVAYFKMWARIGKWLWRNVLKPAFEGIGKLAGWLWKNAIRPAINFIVGAFKTLAAVGKWLWNNALKPAINLIGKAFSWLWRNIVVPAFRGIRTTISFAWNRIIKPVFGFLRAGISKVGDVFAWLRDKVVKPVWNWISDKIGNIWRNGIRPIFDAIGDRLSDLGGLFETAKKIIGDAWKGVANVVRVPINWVIENVINKGIVGTFNKIADTVKLPKKIRLGELGTVKPMATGGRVPGSGRGDKVPTLLEPNEYVIPRAAVSRYGVGFFEAIRAQKLQGGGLVSLDGHTFTAEMARRLKLARHYPGVNFSITQGGFRPYTSYSKGTHGKDAVDAVPPTFANVLGMRKAGIIAWDRTGKGNWIPHIHGVPFPGHGVQLSPSALSQVRSFQGGGDGLGGRDNGPGGVKGVAMDVLGAVGGFIEGAWKTAKSVGGWAKDKAQAAYDFIQDAGGVLRKFLGNAVKKRLGMGLEGDAFLVKIARQFPSYIVGKIVDGAKGLAKRIVGADGGATPFGKVTDMTTAQKYASNQLGFHGWMQSEFPPLYKLWQRESNWNYKATNPSSGAYGIPQALPAYKMQSAGHDWHSNAATQIRWGLQYIKDRYGSPSAAWAFWQRNNWYDEGGILPPGITMAVNNTGRNEYILTREQLRDVAGTGGGQVPEVRVYIGERELKDMVRVQLVDHDTGLARTIQRGRRP